MTSRAPDAYDPARFEVPVPPQEFGQDGGKFYRCYDALADEIDDNLVAGLKEHLDGLLIFAGLFAGVNTAFLALTLPLMSPDPTDDTNALLRNNNAILLNIVLGRNESLPSTNPLPSETFSPTGKVLTINILFAVSLTFALVSSFLAVLGRQWLIYYRKRTGGGPDLQRWEQLKRFLGAERWQLEWVLDDFLPSLLQIGLIVFSISLTIYLSILHPTLSNIFGAFMCTGLAILMITAIFAIRDKFCPFQSPLSRFISWFTALAVRVAIALLGHLLFVTLYPVYLIYQTLYHSIQRSPARQPDPSDLQRFSSVQASADPGAYERFLETSDKFQSDVLNSTRQLEPPGNLQIIAIKRALLTSDDVLTQAHAASNILSITDPDLLRLLATDDEFVDRIRDLCKSSYNRALQLLGRDQVGLASEIIWVYRAAIAHIVFSTNIKITRLITYQTTAVFIDTFGGMDEPQIFLPPNLIQNSSPNMINACLSFVARYANRERNGAQARRLALRPTIEGLANPSWRCISMITEIIMVQWGIHRGSHEEVYAAFLGLVLVSQGVWDLSS
ncbi:hypothetical protein M407DRAFT_28245 [Tulasnella calospora MUT 4182]|uniref:DUF6535 domain-containing protein n=1 Tax=Tulasnella calospora MUT 4182 TaxID=1051891 RepID=A0A0C3QB38_9AGAM|nr:hypothetical protein M407DRAFT_28245 [Tulasnella calospora MUT 4182]